MNNNRAIDLSRRVKKMEQKIGSKNQGGIPEWALEYARKKLTSRINLDFSIFDIVLKKHCEKNIEDTKPPKPITEEDIVSLAKEVSKFSSPDEYEASLPPMDFMAVKKALNRIK